MVKVRVAEDHNQWYWNSGVGHTIRKDNREGIEVPDNNLALRAALDSGILEIVPEKIIADVPDTTKTFKEVVNKENVKQMNKVKKEVTEDAI